MAEDILHVNWRTGEPVVAAPAEFLPPGDDAVARPWITKMREVQLSVTDFGAVGDGVTDDTAAFQAANDTIADLGYGRIFIPPPPVAFMLRTVNASSLVKWYGSIQGESICRQFGPTGDAMFAYRGTTNKDDIEFCDLTLDVNSIDTGIYAEYVQNFRVRRVKTINVPTWGILVGVTSAVDGTIRNSNILFEDVYCEDEESTLEGIVIFNAEKVVVRRCFFDGSATAPGLGIYQNTDNVLVEDCDFANLAQGAYYSVSTNNTRFSKCRFNNCTIGLQGANESDNGMFGFDRVRGLWVDGCDFIDNTNIAFDLGAVRGGGISNCMFYRNDANALVIDAGNSTGPGTVSAPVQDFGIFNTKFVENNTGNTNHSIHPAMYFKDIAHSHINLVNVECYDNQGTPTQRNPITFDGAFTFDNINIIGGRLTSYGGADSITKLNSAALTNVRLIGVDDVLNAPSDTYCLFGVEAISTAAGTWGADSVNPSIGNGTIAFSSKRDGDFIQFSVVLTMGGSTSFGTGSYFFQAPSPFNSNAVADTFGSAYFLDSGVNNYIGTSFIQAGTNKVYLLIENGGGVPVGPTTPFTFASGDQIRFTIRFPIF